MYHVTFPTQSNRASWSGVGLITDLDDNPVDLAGCSMVLAVSDHCGVQRLVASTDNGKLTIVDLGTFQWSFTRDEMRGMCLGTYNTGLTLTNDDDTDTVQLTIGPLPIIDGVVP
jgi:hypothetical protein